MWIINANDGPVNLQLFDMVEDTMGLPYRTLNSLMLNPTLVLGLQLVNIVSSYSN